MKPKLRIVELYAGTARSLEPFRDWARAEAALLLDNNPTARNVYASNYPQTPYRIQDLGHSDPRELSGLAGGAVDVLLACPPCQGFSENGLRRPDDPRNRHVKRFGAFALALRPRAVVMENVPIAAASSEFREMIADLEHAGYAWTAMIANAVQYGSSQNRQRLLFVAIDRNRGAPPIFEPPSHGTGEVFSYSAGCLRSMSTHSVEMLGMSPATQRLARRLPQDFSLILGLKRVRTLGEELEGLPPVEDAESGDPDHSPWLHSPGMIERMGNVPEGGRWQGGMEHFAHTYGRLHRKGLARTLTTFFPYAGAGRFWHPVENRSLTIREAARIQGYPDTFRFGKRSKRIAALIGNALDLVLARLCYQAVRAALD